MTMSLDQFNPINVTEHYSTLQVVKDLGGELVTSVLECTHLVTDKVKTIVNRNSYLLINYSIYVMVKVQIHFLTTWH